MASRGEQWLHRHAMEIQLKVQGNLPSSLLFQMKYTVLSTSD